MDEWCRMHWSNSRVVKRRCCSNYVILEKWSVCEGIKNTLFSVKCMFTLIVYSITVLILVFSFRGHTWRKMLFIWGFLLLNVLLNTVLQNSVSTQYKRGATTSAAPQKDCEIVMMKMQRKWSMKLAEKDSILQRLDWIFWGIFFLHLFSGSM